MSSTPDIFLNEEQFEEIFTSHIKIQTYPKSIESYTYPQKLDHVLSDINAGK
jgi:hypothetical protein